MKSSQICRLSYVALAGFVSIGLTLRTSGDDQRPDVAASEQPYQPKSKAELRRMLSSMQYKVTQQEATEPAFHNRYWNHKQAGTYRCIVCDLALFSSATKYKTGTGWPSFFAPLDEEHVGYRQDLRMIYPRIEVHCKRCQAHLGHVFNDGPRPTGKRYCMNSASLKFISKQEESAESSPSPEQTVEENSDK